MKFRISPIIQFSILNVFSYFHGLYIDYNWILFLCLYIEIERKSISGNIPAHWKCHRSRKKGKDCFFIIGLLENIFRPWNYRKLSFSRRCPNLIPKHCMTLRAVYIITYQANGSTKTFFSKTFLFTSLQGENSLRCFEEIHW